MQTERQTIAINSVEWRRVVFEYDLSILFKRVSLGFVLVAV